MSEEHYCKRCGRLIWSLKSVERGYGYDCYRIHLLEIKKTEVKTLENPELIKNLNDRLNQLGLKNTMLEKKVRKLEFLIKSINKSSVQTNGKINSNVEAIEKIKQKIPEIPETKQTINIIFVIKELKGIFEEKKELLKKDFRFSDEVIGFKTEAELQEVILNVGKNMVHQM